ncbi:MAG: ATP-binding protein [Desulfobacula sp.]|nr:ATP-binding protein [Desulfobacula sp.]
MSILFLDGSNDIQAVLRKSAQNQLDSYADEWIIVFEAIQNALDAVEEEENPEVKVVFDIEYNSVKVYDNGNGFPPDKEFFGLGKGSKFRLRNQNIRGEHGVGIKMVILCSKQFELITKNDNQLWYARFNNGYKFLENEESEYFNDDYSEVERLPEGYNTLVEYAFPLSKDSSSRTISIRNFILSLFEHYENIRPFETYLGKKKKTELYIENYFRTHSYSGDVNRLFDKKKPANIIVEIINDNSLSKKLKKSTYPEHLLEYWEAPYLIQFPSKYWDLTEIYNEPQKKGFLNQDMLKSFTGSNRKFGPSKIWVLKIEDKEQLNELLQNPMLKDYYDSKYFDSTINKIRGIYAVIGSGSNTGKYNINKLLLNKADQIISADGVLTTNQIRTPKRGKNQNYLNNIHIVINIEERVNYGKQGVKNPKLLSQIYKYFEDIYVKSLVDIAISVAGKQPKEVPLDDPDLIITDLNCLGMTNLSIKKEPKLENTLIALTYELIGKGILGGFNTYHLSSFDQYDGKANIKPPKKNEFRSINRDDDLSNIEFKVSLTDLIDNFETNVKRMEDLDLIIIWDNHIPDSIHKYSIVELEYSSYEGLDLPGVTEVLSDMDGNEVPILNIKQVIKKNI